MKKITKFSLIGFGLVISAGILSSCTASFCSPQDTAKILYTMERGVTKYYETAPSDIPTDQLADHTATIGGLTFYFDSSIENSKLLRTTIVPNLQENNYFIPSIEFFDII